ncbi:MAG: sulfatase [Candidatus Eisenbacteria sp.]|nr:sulfatase [Candidatus Eisenbacteria bacterium]
MPNLRRYIGLGLLVGVAAGVIEAAVVNETGWLFVPWAAIAYGLLLAAAFLLLCLVARLAGRDLLPVGLGGSLAFFFALEMGFWINRRSTSLVEAFSSKMTNLGIAAGGLVLGAVAAFLLRRWVNTRSFWRPAWILWMAGAVTFAAYSGFLYFSSSPGWNCILISIDALRADHLGCYGYERETSPNIDQMAREGMLFTRAITSSPGSTGGHGAMLTGLHPLSHGAYTNGMILDDLNITAAEVFKAGGYATGAFTNNWFISPAVGFGQGFDCFVDDGNGLILTNADPRILLRGLALAQTIRRIFKKPGYPSDLEITDALRWIRWQKNHRFFVFLHIMDPHSPYIPPDEFIGRFAERGANLDPRHIMRLHHRAEGNLSLEDKDFLVNRYDEEILSADAKIGMLRDELRRLGLLERTMVVLLADHGEAMGEGRERCFGHGTLDYGVLTIPMILSCPGTIPAGVQSAVPAQSIDVLPTITDILDLPDSSKRQGVSLVSAVRESTMTRRPVFTLGDLDLGENYSLITDRWQFKVTNGEPYLLSLDRPFDCPNLIEEYPVIADSLRLVLKSWIDACLEEAVVPFTLEERRVNPNRAVVGRLKALGYLQ